MSTWLKKCRIKSINYTHKKFAINIKVMCIGLLKKGYVPWCGYYSYVKSLNT